MPLSEIREKLIASDYHWKRYEPSRIDIGRQIVVEEWYVCPRCRETRLFLEHGATARCEPCNLRITLLGNSLACVLG